MTTALKEKFEIYDQANPEVYDKFKEASLIAAEHRLNFAAITIINQIRWESMISGNDDFKINNNYSAYYARKFMDDHKEHSGLFRTRTV